LLFASLLDRVTDMGKSPEYRLYSIQHDHFKHSDKILAQIKAHNPQYTKATQATHWQNYFGRDPKKDAMSFKVYNDKSVKLWFYDVSQTKGRPLAEIYQNISGEVEHFQIIWDCLTNLIAQPVVFGEDGYYSGKGQDSFSKDGQIVMRSALSQQQKVFALVREIVRISQTSAIVIESVSHMVCRHLNFDTGAFTLGYLLELMDFDVSLKMLNNKSIEDTIINEAAVLIGNLNGSLPFLQGESSNGSSAGGNALELEGRQENIGKQEEPETVENVPYTTKERMETVNDLDFQTIAILRDFMRTLPDRKISQKEMIEYGFHDTNMLPMREAVARKLYADKCEIYRLYKDGTHTKVDDPDEFNRHRGYYGISADEWFAVKSNLLRSSMDGKIKEISLWDMASAGDTTQTKTPNIENKKQPKTLEQKKQVAKAQKAQIAKQAEQGEPEEQFEFDESGNMIFDTPEIKHSDQDSYDWIDGVMEDLIDHQGYSTFGIPYFREHGNLGLSAEMEKINTFMIGYCFYRIEIAIAEHTEHCKKTGRSRTFVMKAARQIFLGFNAQYVALALKANWKQWTAHDKIKMQFYNDFKELQKTPQPKIQRKKSTPEEDMARMRAREEAKTAPNVETGKPEQKIKSEHRTKIINLIKSYKDSLKSKPSTTTANRATVKAMREATQAR